MTIFDLETPAVVVDLAILERNIGSMAGYARSRQLSLRPHTKTHKINEIARLQIHYGSSGLTTAKSEEAEIMVKAGCEDVLVAYPVYGRQKWDRLARLAHEAKVTVAVDSFSPIEGLADAARTAGSTIGILLELDVGMGRCGVDTPEAIVDLARAVMNHRSLAMRGVIYYPGHIWARPEKQATALAAVGDRIAAVLHALDKASIPYPIVSGGSTPTARSSHMVSGTTEIRPGTYVFNDRNTLGMGACAAEDIALRVITTVVSTAVAGRAIVDSGSKTLTNDRWLSGGGEGYGEVEGYPDIQITSLSEEHGHLDLTLANSILRVGERVALIPNHVCPCVNLHDQIYFHQDGEVRGSWTVNARGRIR